MDQKDYLELAQNVETMREILRAMVAGLIEDGFTDAQAREIVVQLMTMRQS